MLECILIRNGRRILKDNKLIMACSDDGVTSLYCLAGESLAGQHRHLVTAFDTGVPKAKVENKIDIAIAVNVIFMTFGLTGPFHAMDFRCFCSGFTEPDGGVIDRGGIEIVGG